MFIRVTEIREDVKFCEESEFKSIQQYINSDMIKVIYPSNSIDDTSIKLSDDTYIYVKETADEIVKQINK